MKLKEWANKYLLDYKCYSKSLKNQTVEKKPERKYIGDAIKPPIRTLEQSQILWGHLKNCEREYIN